MAHKLTNEQRALIIKALMDRHFIKAKKLAEQFGCGPSYAKNLRWRRGIPLMPKKVLPPLERREDPRWEWAKRRGVVSL